MHGMLVKFVFFFKVRMSSRVLESGVEAKYLISESIMNTMSQSRVGDNGLYAV
jgi:hypothetical protein